ncbi:MAG: hypothetical protein HEQ22_08980 [Sphingopyxis sp.]|uniref:hypothetical protein n=1 Tax=Sphingopyxis sp. TaxID=1908224 RepID=UPI003D80B2E2
MTKKTDSVTPAGAVELNEDALDTASGGILIGLNQAYKLDAKGLKLDAAKIKFDGATAPIVDTTYKF